LCGKDKWLIEYSSNLGCLGFFNIRHTSSSSSLDTRFESEREDYFIKGKQKKTDGFSNLCRRLILAISPSFFGWSVGFSSNLDIRHASSSTSLDTRFERERENYFIGRIKSKLIMVPQTCA